jgi:dolichol-phosphate hexosyltransferase
MLENYIQTKTSDLQNTTEILVAALNEEPGVGLTISEISQVLPYSRVLLVDGHSMDRTVEIAKDQGANVVFQGGLGKGDAMAAGIQNLDPDVEYVVITDADFTYPATYLPDMIAILEKNPKVGMVCGNRFSKQTEDDAWQGKFYLGNKLLSFAHTVLNGVTMNDPLTGLRVVRANILRDWAVKSKGFDIEVELNHKVEKQGYGIVEVPIKYRARLGEKKLKVKHGVEIFKRILLEALS